MTRQLSIIVPAYNEEARLESTVRDILAEGVRELSAFEVIIVNDGSTDNTAAVANRLAQAHPAVTVITQRVNRGVGAAYYAGLGSCRYPYLTLIPGDHAFHRSGVRAVFAAVGSAELVVSYRANMRTRPFLRRMLSVCCTSGMRLLTGCPIRDAHSMYVFPTERARQIPVNAGYGYHIEALSTLLQTCSSYMEMPVRLNPRTDASSGVMKPRVIAGLIGTMAHMYLRRLASAFGHAGRGAGNRCVPRPAPVRDVV
jgi:glycosyltransferase involved in cell wall biosynthesis